MLEQWNWTTNYFGCEKSKLLLIKCDPKKIQSPSLWKRFLNPSSQVSLHLHIDHLIQFWYYNFTWKDKWEIAYDWIFFHCHVVNFNNHVRSPILVERTIIGYAPNVIFLVRQILAILSSQIGTKRILSIAKILINLHQCDLDSQI